MLTTVPPPDPATPPGFHLHLADIVAKVIAIASAIEATAPADSLTVRICAAVIAVLAIFSHVAIQVAKEKA